MEMDVKKLKEVCGRDSGGSALNVSIASFFTIHLASRSSAGFGYSRLDANQK